MKKIKHFLGWLFRYCPYGHGCPPKHPFLDLVENEHEGIKMYSHTQLNKEDIRSNLGGGGC